MRRVQNSRLAYGFTLIELLVVIAIIAILAAMLLPVLNEAKRAVRVTTCKSSMRQAYIAFSLYGTNFQEYPQNYMPTCPYWNRGGYGFRDNTCEHACYPNGAGTSHGTHQWEEARTLMNYWRGYVIESKLAGPEILGCSISYTSGDFYASYNGGGVANHVETSRTAITFRRNPAYIYFSPMPRGGNNQWGGIQGQTAEYAGGQIYAGHWGTQDSSLPSYRHQTAQRVPMATCPPVWLWYRNSTKYFEPPHRPKYGRTVGGSMRQVRAASNYLFGDGSVGYADKLGWVEPGDIH